MFQEFDTAKVGLSLSRWARTAAAGGPGKLIKKMTPQSDPALPNFINLASNENPCGMSPMAREAAAAALVARHSDFDRLGPAVRSAPAGVSDQ